MATRTAPALYSPVLSRVASALGGLWQMSAALAARLDAWLGARRRAAQDHAALAAMSDRELADIGLPRASVDYAATSAWKRDLLR